MLDHIPTEDKVAAFDALIKAFQGKGRLVHMKRRLVHTKLRTKTVETGPNEAVLVTEDYPVYEFVMRVNGHDDFAAAVLALLPSNANVTGLAPAQEVKK